jgi:hypothetical protein
VDKYFHPKVDEATIKIFQNISDQISKFGRNIFYSIVDVSSECVISVVYIGCTFYEIG